MGSSWSISKDGTLTPSRSALESANKEFFQNIEDDPVITFSFAGYSSSNFVKIHASRLTLAGGPLAAMVTNDFREKQTRTVELSAEEEPFIFQIFKSYLYLCPIDAVRFQKDETFGKIDHSGLIELCLAADRWGLDPLFELACKYVSLSISKFDVETVLALASLIQSTDAPSSLKIAFADRVGKNFDGFMDVLKDLSKPPSSSSAANAPSDNSNFLERLTSGMRSYGAASKENKKKKAKTVLPQSSAEIQSQSTDSDIGVQALQEALPQHVHDFWEIFTAPMMLQMISSVGDKFSPAVLDTLLTHSEHIEEDEDLRQILSLCKWEKVDGPTFFTNPQIGNNWPARALRLALASITTGSNLQRAAASVRTRVHWKMSQESEKSQLGPCVAYVRAELDKDATTFTASVIVSPRSYYDDRDRGMPPSKSYECNIPVRVSIFFTGCVCGVEKLRFGFKEERRQYRYEKETWEFSLPVPVTSDEAWKEVHLPQCHLAIQARVQFLEDGPWDLPIFRRDYLRHRRMHDRGRHRYADYPEAFLD